MAQASSLYAAGTFRTLLRMARPYKKRFLVIALLALLGTSADLLQPLIYRVAINDVAGLFVDRTMESRIDADEASEIEELSPGLRQEQSGGSQPTNALPGDSRPATAKPETTNSGTTKSGSGKSGATSRQKRIAAGKRRRELELARARRTQLQHRPGFVAPRTGQQTLQTLLWAVAGIFLISVTGYLLSLAAEYQSTVVACRIEANLIQSTFGHVMQLPISFFNRRASGGLAKRIDQSDQVAPIVSAFSQQIAPEAVRIVGICVIMLTQSWRMAVVALCVLPLYFMVTRRASRRLESGMAEYYTMWENVSARIQDALAAIKTVKLSGAESREVSRLHDASQEAYDDYLVRARLGNRYLFLQSALSQFSKALVLGYGGFLVFDRRLTPGDVVMFVAYLDRLYDPIDSLSSIAVNLQQNLASLSRAVQLLETGPMEVGGAALQPGPGKIEFCGVRFGYTKKREVLQGLTFTAAPGKVTALTGPSGAGKTTAADLLLKLWEPQAGEIRLDGQSLAGVGAAAVRQAIGLVATDGAVFRGTLADNIRYKRPDATDEEVRNAAFAAGLGNTLERLPEGLLTEIGERGVGLSVGERQRLQIARILVDHPRILVLDEATANLDYATENEVKQALSRLDHHPTTLLIAHRYSMIKDADQVIVLNEGKIVEEGTPDQLTAAGGWFAQLATQSAQNA